MVTGKSKYCSHGSRMARSVTYECHGCAREEIASLRVALETAERDRDALAKHIDIGPWDGSSAEQILKLVHRKGAAAPCLICTLTHPLDGPCGDPRKGGDDGE